MFFREQLFGRRLFMAGLLLVVLLIIMVACGGTTDPISETIQQSALSPGDAVPLPTGPIILTITGNISNTNQGNSLVFDIETLESVGLVRYTVADPWQQKDIAYSGVLLADLMAVAGAGEAATAVNVVALNDYAAEVPISETDAWPVLLATQSDGLYMAVDNTGPTRIIFPYDSYTDISAARNMSVWNIASLDVR
jgi:hypothetical protein